MAKTFTGVAPTPTINLFENLLEQVLLGTNESVEKETTQNVEVEDYLKKGERLMTLAKEAFDNSDIDLTSLEEALLNVKFKGYSYESFREGVAKVFRKHLSSITGEPDESEATKEIYKLFGSAYDFRFSASLGGCTPIELSSTYFGKGAVNIGFSYKEEADGGVKTLQLDCPSVGKWSRGLRRYRYKRNIYIFDLGTVLADLYISKVVSESLFDSDSTASSKTSWIRDNDLIEYAQIDTKGKDRFAIFTMKKYVGSEEIKQVWTQEKIKRLSELLGDKHKLRVYECAYQDVPAENYEDCYVLSVNILEILEEAYTIREYVLNKRFLPLSLLYLTVKKASVVFPSTCDHDAIDVECADILRPCEWGGNGKAGGFYKELFELGIEKKRIFIQMRKFYNSQKKEHAKAFQEKKNIPIKTQKAMEKSKFNEWFGYVEFDESVDLRKIEELEKEFEVTMTTFFPTLRMQDNSIRFRLIGNYKASGLYFPFFRTLVVDVRHPSSLIHELGHLIDYKFKNLSTESSFYEVRKIYEKEVDKSMKSDESNSKKWNGSGKYNRAYYLTPTEIFARSFEIYMSKVKGLENSLLEMPDGYESFCYPASDKYLEAITNYFNMIFDKLFNVVVEEKEKIA